MLRLPDWRFRVPLLRAALVVVGVAAVTSCGVAAGGNSGADLSGSATPSLPASVGPSGPGAYEGELSSGGRIVVAIDEKGQVLVTWSEVDCTWDGGSSSAIKNLIDPYDPQGTIWGGDFAASSDVNDEGTDGAFEDVIIDVRGSDLGGGRMAGTLSVTSRSDPSYGEDEDSNPTCDSGEVEWSAQASDDDDLDDELWVFRHAARSNIARVENLLTTTVDPKIVHPIRGTNLRENVSEECALRTAYGGEGNTVTMGSEPMVFPPAPVMDLRLSQLGVPPVGLAEDAEWREQC
jgi:hypothetical protein